MLEPVALEDVSKYGIADINGVKLTAGESAVIKRMVEKPAAEVAPSNLAVVGRYVLSKNIWPLLAKTHVGAGGEIQLTDAIDSLLAIDTVEAFHMSGRSHDCGDKLGYLKAI
ncbi:sugar phosphate nucleotidyltransferase, partial [Psychrobacter sp. SIMBA_152]